MSGEDGDDDPASGAGDERDGDDEESTGGTDADRDEPLGGLTDRIRRSGSPEGSGEAEETADDPFAALERAVEEDGDAAGGDDSASDDEDPFERVDVDDIDEEEVWESLDADEEPEADQPSIGAGADAERVERDDPGAERPDHIVEKSAYCQRCRFFSDPPAVRCTHKGTAIVEVVDSERFRIRGCPMVAQGGAVERDPDGHDDEGDDGTA